jgi:hypothetical protein
MAPCLILRTLPPPLQKRHSAFLVTRSARGALTHSAGIASLTLPSQALLHICRTWGAPPSRVIMVGDSVKDDIVCGNRAGAVTVLVDLNGMSGYCASSPPPPPARPAPGRGTGSGRISATDGASRKNAADGSASGETQHAAGAGSSAAAAAAAAEAAAESSGLSGEKRPAYIVSSLGQLAALLSQRFELVPPPSPYAAVAEMTRDYEAAPVPQA